jgi:hypothetical protein
MGGHIKINLVSRFIWLKLRTCDECCKYSKEPYFPINGITSGSTKRISASHGDELEWISKVNIMA